ncbi:hypothetical protein HPB52_018265 [Rhipicephalus sanguineus]|uniref:Secreted protein n=1 Tax=Rhipicephalus sanguineus TaxID=34632 RepID=A0A9D4SRC4_RHISA|nr:hypothetical protein HPB52_018265 [Rhipicephalus sanguineus]
MVKAQLCAVTCVIALCCDWCIIVREPGWASAARLQPLRRESTALVPCRHSAGPVLSNTSASAGKRPPARRQDTKSRSSQAGTTPSLTKTARRSVATWTHQNDQEAPSYFVSDLSWKAQWWVRRETSLDRMSWPFRGRTVAEADVRSQGARLPDPPGIQACALRVVTVYLKSHYQEALHVANKKPARDSGHHEKAPTPPATFPALPDQDLARPCVGRGCCQAQTLRPSSVPRCQRLPRVHHPLTMVPTTCC